MDVMAVAKMQVLHPLLKHDLLPDKSHLYQCPNCIEEVGPDDIDLLRDLSISNTQSLLQTSHTKSNFNFMITMQNIPNEIALLH